MKKMKKLAGFIAAAVICLQSTVSVCADTVYDSAKAQNVILSDSENISAAANFSSEFDMKYFSYDYHNDYFYQKLNDKEKEFYENLYNANMEFMFSDIDLVSDSNYGSALCAPAHFDSSISSERMRQIYRAFRFSNPQFFFFGTCAFYGGWSSSKTTCYAKCGESFLKAADRKAMLKTIESKAKLWLPQIQQGKNTEEKLNIIYNIMCDNIYYDYNAYGSDINVRAEYHQTIAGAIGEGKCVCNGYAMAFNYLCHLAGIESVGIVGNGHAWNRVKIYGKWYETDVTWMDQGSYINWAWCNKSTAQMQAEDKKRGRNTHSNLRTDLYDGFEPPLCITDEIVEPEFTLGDINKDGYLNDMDIFVMKTYLTKTTGRSDDVYDVNGDEYFDIRDLSALIFLVNKGQ